MPIASLDPVARSHRRRLIAAFATILVAVALVLASVPLLSADLAGLRSTTPPEALAAHAQPVGAVMGTGAPARLPTRRPDPDPEIPTAIVASPPAVALGPSADVVYRVKTPDKVVALTFDDGWSPAAGRAILATLLKLHVKATFFVNAIYVHRDPGLWRAIDAAGFPIGNHTFDHRKLTGLPYGDVLAEAQKDASVFHRLTGLTLAPIFRPPYGARDRTVDAAVNAAGYPTEILWNVVANDTDAKLSDRQLVANASAGGPGSIVLLHVGPLSTPRILAAVIARYQGRGFTFVTIPELLALRS